MSLVGLVMGDPMLVGIASGLFVTVVAVVGLAKEDK